MKLLFSLFLFVSLNYIANAQNWQTLGLGVSGATLGIPTVNCIGYVDGKITIGGYFTNSGTTILNGVGQWNGNEWLQMETGLHHAILSAGNSGIGFEYYSYKDTTYLAGSFTTAGGTSGTDSTHSAKNIAKWDGVQWRPIKRWGDGFYGGAGSMIEFNNNLIIGGGFSGCSDSTYYLPTTTIAKWNDTVFSSIGSLTSNHPSGNDYVQDLCVHNGKLIAAGYFNSIDGSPFGSYGYIAAYNDTTWSLLGTGFNAPVWALTVFNGELYAGGMFTATGDNLTLLNHVAKWDEIQWLQVGEGLNDTVSRFCIDTAQNILYAGGAFTQTGLSLPAKHIAGWNGISWVEVGGGTNGFVYGMFSKDSNLYVGGTFTQAGFTPANHIAVWGNNPVGINEISKKDNLTIYPNPSSNEIKLAFEQTNSENTQIEIQNVLGQTVYSEILKTNIGKQTKTLDISSLNNGVYFIQFKNKTNTSTTKFVKQ